VVGIKVEPLLTMSAIRVELELQQHDVWNCGGRKVDVGSRLGSVEACVQRVIFSRKCRLLTSYMNDWYRPGQIIEN
jgi:hypothetical protein